MNREEFIAWLGRLVADGAITEAEARDLLQRFDAGDLPPGFTLPSPPAPPKETRLEELAAMLAILLALLGRRSLAGAPFASVDVIQRRFERRAALIAGRLADGAIDLPGWQREMTEELRRLYYRQIASAWQGRIGEREMIRLIDGNLRREIAYLSRFADQIALRTAQGQPPTAAGIANRAALYAGNARGLFYEQAEQAMIAQGQLRAGWVVDYISRDDSATCSPCLVAGRRGPYVPGRPHPVPGRVCLGRSRCRCRLRYRYDPDTYARLTENQNR